jgi:hypothetical protein
MAAQQRLLRGLRQFLLEGLICAPGVFSARGRYCLKKIESTRGVRYRFGASDSMHRPQYTSDD